MAADCMAYAMGAPDDWPAYTANCKGARASAAKAVLAGTIPSVK
jgi:hypothetical protein